MSIRDFIKSIIVHKRIFAFLVALSIALCSIYLTMAESYTAEIIIKYICDSAEEGLTENGESINPNEINSAYVVKNAVSALGLDEKDTEKICRNITITPIVPTAEEEKYASWIDDFSDYEITEDGKKFSVYYSIKYTSSNGQNDAERILGEVINQYRSYYTDNYIYSHDVTMLSDEAVLQYDYYDTAAMLREKITAKIDYLTEMYDSDYRSSSTGYSIADLIDEYQSLSDREVSVAERMILENGITKDASYLINSLQSKATDAQYNIELNNKKAQTQQSLMSVYSEKNKQYLWNDDGSYNDDDDRENAQVYTDVERDRAQSKSVYDNLILDYVAYRKNALYEGINKQRYENDITSFSDNNSDTELQAELEQSLKNICDKYNDLYEITKNTLDDYNVYRSANSIESTSGVVSYKTANTVFYYTVSITIALMLGFVLCALLAYTDEKKDTKEKYEA